MGYFLWRVSSSEIQADYFCRLLTAASIFMPITAYHFSIILSGEKVNRPLHYGYLGALILCLMLPSGLIMQGVKPKFGHRYWPEAGPLAWLYLTYFFGYLLASAGVFIRGWKEHLGNRAAGNLFFLCTWIAGCLGGITNFPLWFDIPVQPYGNVFLCLFLIFLSQALYSNFFTVRFQIYKNLFHLILCASAALVYVLLITYYFNTINTPLSPELIWIHGIGAFLLIALTSWVVSTIKYQVERALEAVFLNEPTIGLTKLKELPAKFTEFNDNLSLLNFVANSVEQFVPTQNLAIFTKEPESDSYRTVAKRGHFPDAAPLHEIASNDPLIESLTNNPRALDINKVTKSIDPLVYQSLVDLRNASNVSMLIPIFSNQQLFGLILLGPLKSKQDWDNQTTTILFTLSAQIGIHFRTLELEAIVDLRSTELEQRNKQLETAHIEKHNFLTSFSHEIRNPLNGIINISQLLAEEKGLTKVQSELIDYLISCKQHLEQLIIPTLDYSSLEAGIYNCTEETFDINIILKSIIAMHTHQAKSKGLQISMSTTEVRNNWIGAVTPLRQILINLTTNAIKYTTSGTVRLQLSYQQLDGNITATFLITDTGPGISTDRHKDIFEPLTRLTENQNSQPGSGMGLSISRKIAQTLQGTLSLKESSPIGSVFELTLPFKLGASIDVNISPSTTPQILNDKRVLLADDMDFNRYAYRILLERMGAIVSEVCNGEQALEKLQSEHFDVVILDINMPMMSGIEVAREYFLTPTINPPVFIAYSALNDKETADNCLNTGFHHFIEKPLTNEKLRLLFNSKEFNSKEFNSKESKSIPPQGDLLDYLGGGDSAKVAQLNKRYRQSFNQGLAELTQLIKQREQSEMHSCMHKLRGLACLQNNTNEMRILDEMSVLIAANALPHKYTELLDQLKDSVTDNAISVIN
jgi:signal transduction histidine kinase/CheY-like chemotaxis protein